MILPSSWLKSMSSLHFDRHGRCLRGFDNEFLLTEMYAAGAGAGRAEDACFENRTGRVCLVDMSRGFTNATDAIRTRSFLIPHAAVAYDPGGRTPE